MINLIRTAEGKVVTDVGYESFQPVRREWDSKQTRPATEENVEVIDDRP